MAGRVGWPLHPYSNGPCTSHLTTCHIHHGAGLVRMLNADSNSASVTNSVLTLEALAFDEQCGAAMVAAGGVPKLTALMARADETGATVSARAHLPI